MEGLIVRMGLMKLSHWPRAQQAPCSGLAGELPVLVVAWASR